MSSRASRAAGGSVRSVKDRPGGDPPNDDDDDRTPRPIPGGGDRDALLADAAGRARRYLAGLADRPVFPVADDVAALDRLDFALPGAGLPAAEVVDLLDRVGSPATVASAGPRYFGFVTGGALPAAVAAAWMSAAWDQNAAMAVMSPVAARLDAVALGWVVDLLGLPGGTTGAFVSGATMANATCLAVARDAVLARAGWDAGEDGLVGAPPVTVVVGEEAHSAVIKAAGLVGLGRGRARRLAVDDQGRIRADADNLGDLDGPAIVCLQAGNVNSGASDPFGPLIDWARSQGAWVHIDGAFGLWAAACPETAGQVAGMEGADSWATDAHKWLNTTYDCGVALVRDQAALQAAMGLSAAYLPPGAGRDPMQYGPQASQRARGVEVWAGPGLPRPGRPGRPDRGRLPPGPPLRGPAGAGRRGGAQPGGPQPGGGRLRRRRSHRGGHRRRPGGGDLLVRAHAVAGPVGHAHQREQLGHHRSRRGPQRRRGDPGRPSPGAAGALSGRAGGAVSGPCAGPA